MTQPPNPPSWPAPGTGQAPQGPGTPSWQQPAAQPWQQPAAPSWQPPGPGSPGAPAWEQRPGAPGSPPGTPPSGGPPYGGPQKPSRKGLWWALGAAAVVVVVAAGLLVWFLTRPLDPPTGVDAALADGGVQVSWQAVEDAASYEVFRDDESIGTTEESSYLDTEAAGGTEHRYSVAAVDEDGELSETVAAADAVLTPVDPPSEVSATADGPDVLLEWSEVTGADVYEVSRNGEVLAADVTGTSYTDSDVPLGDHAYEITAVDEDGEGSTAVSPSASVFSAGPWQDAYRIGVAFDELVGIAPGAGGWNGGICQSDPGVAGTLALVYCEYPDGIYVEVIEFADAAQRDARVAEIAGLSGQPAGTWSYGSGAAQGDLYLSAPDTNPAWRFLTFYGGGDELFCVYAEWEGHSQEELRDTWFAGAPF